MARMVRKQVYIGKAQESMLKHRASELGIAEAELIREGIGLVMEAGAAASPGTVSAFESDWDDEAWAEALAFMERSDERGPTAGGRTWRRDDLHERGADDS